MKVPQNFHAIRIYTGSHFPFRNRSVVYFILFFYLSLEVRKSRTRVVSLVYFHVFPSSVAMTASAESHQTGMAVKLSNLLELLATSHASMHL